MKNMMAYLQMLLQTIQVAFYLNLSFCIRIGCPMRLVEYIDFCDYGFGYLRLKNTTDIDLAINLQKEKGVSVSHRPGLFRVLYL